MTKTATTKPSSVALMSLDRFLPIASESATALVDAARDNLGAGDLISPWDLQRIRVPAGGGLTWELPNMENPGEPSPEKTLRGIVIYHTLTRSFWKDEFSGAGTPPNCFSPDARFGNGDPHDNAGARMHISCAECPNSQFGTAIKGSGQACRQIRLAFFLREDMLLPSLVGVTPGSLRQFKKFLMDLTSQGKSISNLVLGLNLEQAKSGNGITYSRIAPTVVREIPPDERAKLLAYINEIRPILGAFKSADLAGVSKDFAGAEASE